MVSATDPARADTVLGAKSSRFTIWLDDRLRFAIERLAEDHDVSVGWVIRRLCGERLDAIGYLLSEEEQESMWAADEARVTEWRKSQAGGASDG